ncbi:MAG: hypothetical protein HZB26_19610 [Candidatus Hydrogenedentes bacterium]|nr:hypothetical protein [Candidatus Hydrogenedentota bacterium]
MHLPQDLRASSIISSLTFVLGTALAVFGDDLPTPSSAKLRAMNYVVVSPEGPKDGGDFGPLTPNTKTSGIQEAFNSAKANRKDVYIAGGTMPEAFKGGVVYHIQETIRIPWFQDFRLDGGEYVINYDRDTGDAMVIDSQMSCRFKFGLIVSPSGGVAVHLKPETKGPDGFAVITTSTFEFNAVVGGGSVFPDGKQHPKGTGLFLDASVGPILHNKFYATEIIACETGLLLTCGPNGNRSSVIADNNFEIPMIHLCDTHMQIGNADSHVVRNILQANITSENLAAATGVRIFGKRNLLTLDVQTIAKDRGVVFEAPAEDNRITAVGLSAGYTNSATRPTNRIIPMQPLGMSIETPAVPATAVPVVNRTPYTVDALITAPGAVTAWTLTAAADATQTVSAPLAAGQTIHLEPGDSVCFTYTQAPTWRWRVKS